MIETQKPGSISVRKYNKEKDPVSNVIKGVKLSDNHRITHKIGKSYSIYINKDRLKQIKKMIEEKPDEYKGSFLPFLIPLLAGLGAVGSLLGGAAGVTKAVLDKKSNDLKQEEEKRHNIELEKAARGEGIVESNGIFMNPPNSWKSYGMSLDVKDFVNNSKLDDIGRKSLRNILKNLSSYFKIEKQGEGIFMQPYTS